MLWNVGYLKIFRQKNVSTTCYLVHQSSTSALEFENHEKLRSNSLSDYFNLRFLICSTYYFIIYMMEKATKSIISFLRLNIWSEWIQTLVFFFFYPGGIIFIIITEVTFNKIEIFNSRKLVVMNYIDYYPFAKYYL
jgi:hypothetical protein